MDDNYIALHWDVAYGQVSNMLEVPTAEARPVLSLDMTRMTKLLSLDEANGIAVIECGANGRDIEVALNARGYIYWNAPDTIEREGAKRMRFGSINRDTTKAYQLF